MFSRYRGPLSNCYMVAFIRENTTPTLAQIREDYGTNIDTRLCTLVRFEGPMYEVANGKFYDLLAAATKNNKELKTAVTMHRATKDGRKAWLELQERAWGEDAKNQHAVRLLKIVEQAVFTGKSKNFPFSCYAEKHREYHQKLATLGRTYKKEGCEKVIRLSKGIKNDILIKTMDDLLSDPQSSCDLEKCVKKLNNVCTVQERAGKMYQDGRRRDVASLHGEDPLDIEWERNGTNKNKGGHNGGNKKQSKKVQDYVAKVQDRTYSA